MTIQEFFNMIMLEKQNQTALNDLTTVNDAQTLLDDVQTENPASDHNIWAWIFAFVAFKLWNLIQLFKKEVDEKLAKEKTPTIPWHVVNCKKFQLGHLLVLNAAGDQYVYTTDDPAARIIKFCAADEHTRVIKYKVAKDNGSGNPEPLDAITEVPQLLNYLERTRPAGPKIEVISTTPDLLWLEYDIYHDPLISDMTQFKTNCEAAINGYLSNSNKEFRGIISIPDITNELEKVSGVKYPVPTSTKHKYQANPYTSFDVVIPTFAGYAVIDIVNHPLSATLNYIPFDASQL